MNASPEKSLSAVRHFALDLDGTLYLGGRLFEWTVPFLDTLRRLGLGRTFFTNNSSKSTQQYVQSLRGMGIDVRADEIYSSTTSTLDYLRAEHPHVRRLYVLGTPGLREEFAGNGFEVVGEAHDDEPDAVVVGFDTSLTYPRLSRAAWWIGKGKTYLATNIDRVCPTDQPIVLPDCASICKMLEHATGRAPQEVLGKPNPRMLQGVMQRHGLAPHQLAVVGDRIYTDMAMARAAGATGVLVLSGEATAAEARAAQPPLDLVLAHVGELAARLG